MSIRIMSAVWDRFPGGGSELLALLALADWSDDEGRCWPSMTAISEKTRLSRSQAQRVVHGLIDAGFLNVIGNEAGGKPGSTRRYQINLRALTGRADATPTGRTHATGSANATGRTHAQDGSHPCGETGRTHATQTISEPSRTVSEPMSLDIGGVQAKPAHLPDCPHQQIIDLYHQALPTGTRVRVWSGTRVKHLQARWREDTKRQNVEWWQRFFAYCAQSEFLTGQAQPVNGRDPFVVSLDWLVSPQNFAKCIEGKYHRSAA